MLLLRLNKVHYFNGAVRMYKGDEWVISAKIVDRIGGVDTDKDLTDYGVTGYFPTTGDAQAVVATVDTGDCGKISMTVDEAVTAVLEENTNGVQLYCIIASPASGENPLTVQMAEPDFQIADRGFLQT